MDEALREFLEEGGEHLDAAARDLARLRRQPDADTSSRLFRRLHTLKGTAAFLPLPRLTRLAHLAETGLERVRADAAPSRTAALAAAIARMRAILDGVRRDAAEPEGDDADLAAILDGPAASPERPDLLPEPPSAAVMRLVPQPRPDTPTGNAADGRPLPLDRALSRLPGLVRHLEAALAKPLDLGIEGGGIAVAPGIARVVRDALPHLVRNAADHGIEPPAPRRAAGKPERGRIAVAARREGEAVAVTVRDDGAGLDLAAIARAASLGACLPAPREAERLVLRPGLSTAARVTVISGRGIGLDAVRALVEEAGGVLEISSEPGRGTACTLRLPLGPALRLARPCEVPSSARSVRP